MLQKNKDKIKISSSKGSKNSNDVLNENIVNFESSSSLGYFFLFLYTIGVLIRPQDFLPILKGVPFVMILTILAFFCALYSNKEKKWAPQQTFLIAILPFIAISAFLNGWGSKGISEAFNMLVSSIVPLFLFVVLTDSISRQNKIFVISIVASLLMIHNGWVQQTSLDSFGWTGTQAVGLTKRIVYVGIFSDPNDLGMLLVMNIPLVIYFFIRGGLLTKLLCFCILVTFLYGILITGSRGTLLGLAALIGFYFLFKYGGARLIVAGLIAGPVLATLISQRGGLSSDDASARGRLYAWYDGIQYLISNPIFGIGKDNFVGLHGRTAHNSYVLIAGELGALVYTFWGGALALTVYIGYRVFNTSKTNFEHHPKKESVINDIQLSNALFFAMVGFLITAFFLSRSYVLLLYIFMGLNISVQYRLMKYVPEIKDLFNYKMAFKAGIFSWIMLILVYGSVRFTL